MRRNRLSALALAIATGFPGGGHAIEADVEKEKLPALGSGISPVALIAAGLAAAAALAGGGGGGSGGSGASSTTTPGDGTGGGTSAPPSTPPSVPTRSLSYASAADFQTSEYSAQQGLRIVKADALYYNGHYQWYQNLASDPTAGTGVGVKIAVADTGINAREGSTGGVLRIDDTRSYDYINNRAGSAADDYGHGTHVAGLIAAPKNGAGMHGLAYNATIVNFKVGDANGFISASDAQLGDMFGRAASGGAMILNNSWSSASSITVYTAQDLQSFMPRMIDGARAYVARGGVVVFAAGNEMSTQPSIQAGLPHRFRELTPGWLAVVAIDGSGKLADYSNRCGVAADWCLAAPGGSRDTGLYSMYGNGSYANLYGTSMAAPHASAALAGLKSMFPNLSYQQLRDRLLFTANRSGAYGDELTYGQGLMDLAAASSPVNGVSVPTGSSANGTTAALTGSGIEFQSGALQALRMQGAVLVVDNYQRAPFWVPAQTFFREATPRLMERQWASLRTGAQSLVRNAGSALRFSHSAGLNNVVSADLATYRLGFSKGAGGEAVLGSHLELAWLPHLASPGVDSLALGYASDLGGLRIGLVGTLPSREAASERTVESSTLGSRRAFGFVAQHRAGSTTYGVSLAVAEDFERPIGVATSGAFGVDDSAALSSGTFVEHAFGARSVLKASLEVARHRPEVHGTLSTPAYAVRSATFGARTVVGTRTALSAEVKREWSGGGAARLHVPTTIAESGEIGRVTYALPYDDLVGRTTLTLRVDHPLTRQAEVRAALTRERTGFGTSVTGIAAILEITH